MFLINGGDHSFHRLHSLLRCDYVHGGDVRDDHDRDGAMKQVQKPLKFR